MCTGLSIFLSSPPCKGSCMHAKPWPVRLSQRMDLGCKVQGDDLTYCLVNLGASHVRRLCVAARVTVDGPAALHQRRQPQVCKHHLSAAPISLVTDFRSSNCNQPQLLQKPPSHQATHGLAPHPQQSKSHAFGSSLLVNTLRETAGILCYYPQKCNLNMRGTTDPSPPGKAWERPAWSLAPRPCGKVSPSPRR